jgi:hypothetical protein
MNSKKHLCSTIFCCKILTPHDHFQSGAYYWAHGCIHEEGSPIMHWLSLAWEDLRDWWGYHFNRWVGPHCPHSMPQPCHPTSHAPTLSNHTPCPASSPNAPCPDLITRHHMPRPCRPTSLVLPCHPTSHALTLSTHIPHPASSPHVQCPDLVNPHPVCHWFGWTDIIS